MTTRGRRRKSVTERLRAIVGRSVNPEGCTCGDWRHGRDAPHWRSCPHYQPTTRLRMASFEHSHRVWIPEDPPRSWFEKQGIERVDKPKRFRW